MSDPIVPAATKKAAIRGFIRTTAQSIATALAGGITVNTVLAAIDGGKVNLTVLAVTAAVAVVTPFLNGLQSYLSIISNGIPDEYQPTTTHPAAQALRARAGDSDKIANPDLYPHADVQAARSRAGLPPVD